MANFTNTHKMTGVGNALKRHYQALCLDYELAHPGDLDKQVTHQHSSTANQNQILSVGNGYFDEIRGSIPVIVCISSPGGFL